MEDMEIYKIGSRGEVVRQIQKALHLIPDGIFGELTEEAVRQFQTDNGLKVDGIVGPATLAKLIPQRLKTSKRTITEIIVHCSDTPEGRNQTVNDIRAWHKARGFADIGYHYVVYRDGSVAEGRDINLIGAHCTGHNSHSIGVCYVGGCEGEHKNGKIVPKTDEHGNHIPKDTRTLAQKASLINLLKDLRRLYPYAKIRGHRDFANKACPSFDATQEYKTI